MLVDGREWSRRIVALTDGLYVFEVQSTGAGSRTINITPMMASKSKAVFYNSI